MFPTRFHLLKTSDLKHFLALLRICALTHFSLQPHSFCHTSHSLHCLSKSVFFTIKSAEDTIWYYHIFNGFFQWNLFLLPHTSRLSIKDKWPLYQIDDSVLMLQKTVLSATHTNTVCLFRINSFGAHFPIKTEFLFRGYILFLSNDLM